jgi:hypothetical protein
MVIVSAFIFLDKLRTNNESLWHQLKHQIAIKVESITESVRIAK